MAQTIFVGVGRGTVRRELARKNMATLMGIAYSEFVKRYEWDNLYGDEKAPGSTADDRRRAEMLIPKLARYDEAVLLGGRVAKAFRCANVPLYSRVTLPTSPPIRIARIPHTSRRMWDTQGQGRGPYWEPAREFLRTVGSSS